MDQQRPAHGSQLQSPLCCFSRLLIGNLKPIHDRTLVLAAAALWMPSVRQRDGD